MNRLICSILLFLLDLVGCTTNNYAVPAVDMAQVDYAHADDADLAHSQDAETVTDLARADLAESAAADLAHPTDLESACGGGGQPCCGDLSSALPAPDGTWYQQGTCSENPVAASCLLIGNKPTCELCGGTHEWCCGPGALVAFGESQSAQCFLGETCTQGDNEKDHCD